MNQIKKIFVHHSYSVDNNKIRNYDDIVKWHVEENGWNAIGYNAVSERVNGVMTTIPGRPEGATTAAVLGWNDKSLSICLVGNFDTVEPDEEQYDEVAKWCSERVKKYKLTIYDILPHSAVAPKSCPGTKFDMVELYDKVRGLM